jgi:hypothetical protein
MNLVDSGSSPLDVLDLRIEGLRAERIRVLWCCI